MHSPEGKKAGLLHQHRFQLAPKGTRFQTAASHTDPTSCAGPFGTSAPTRSPKYSGGGSSAPSSWLPGCPHGDAPLGQQHPTVRGNPSLLRSAELLCPELTTAAELCEPGHRERRLQLHSFQNGVTVTRRSLLPAPAAPPQPGKRPLQTPCSDKPVNSCPQSRSASESSSRVPGAENGRRSPTPTGCSVFREPTERSQGPAPEGTLGRGAAARAPAHPPPRVLREGPRGKRRRAAAGAARTHRHHDKPPYPVPGVHRATGQPSPCTAGSSPAPARPPRSA